MLSTNVLVGMMIAAAIAIGVVLGDFARFGGAEGFEGIRTPRYAVILLRVLRVALLLGAAFLAAPPLFRALQS